MTNIGVKTVGELFESVGPTEDHRQKFGQTLRGSLLGQAVAAAYLVECSRAALLKTKGLSIRRPAADSPHGST